MLHRREVRAGVACALLLLGVAILLTTPISVSSQYIPCNIVNLFVAHPDSVPAGQILQVSTSITGSCDPSASYILEVDLVDQRSGTIISSVKVPYFPTVASFTQRVNNTATAPSTFGSWVLQDQAYIISAVNGQVAASSSWQFVVNVTPYSPPATTEVTSTTNASQVYVVSTSLSQPTLNSTQTTSSLMPTFTTSETTAQPSQTLIEVLVAILIVGAAAFFIAMMRKRSATPSTQPPKASYCAKCGTQLSEGDNFCGKCGAKQ